MLTSADLQPDQRSKPQSNGQPTSKWDKWGWVLVILVAIPAGILIANLVSNRDVPSTLSASEKRAIFYNIVKQQDQNPDSNEWNQVVKEAAAKHYNITMSELNDIILEGVKSNWPSPDL